MPIAVQMQHVFDRVGVSGTSYEMLYNSIYPYLLQAIEYAVDPQFVSNANTQLQITLSLGATEIIAGEFIACLDRRPEARLALKMGEIEFYPRRSDTPEDPSGLIRKGWERLWPYLKVPPPVPPAAGVVRGQAGKGAPNQP